MAALQSFTLEFPIQASPKVLFTLISTAEGLAMWFADKVTLTDNRVTFEWEGSLQQAQIIESKENEFVKFRWEDDFHEGYIMEMAINHESVSGDSALIITDYSEKSDIEFTQMWYSNQLSRLLRMFNGSQH